MQLENFLISKHFHKAIPYYNTDELYPLLPYINTREDWRHPHYPHKCSLPDPLPLFIFLALNIP